MKLNLSLTVLKNKEFLETNYPQDRASANSFRLTEVFVFQLLFFSSIHLLINLVLCKP